MLFNGRAKFTAALIWAGCSCHNSKKHRRKVKHGLKQAEKRQWKQDAAN